MTPSDPAPQNIPADALVISNGRVIGADGSDPIPDGGVVIQQDRILAVGHLADFAAPQGVQVIDAHGGTIMPGIVNAHVHGVASPLIRRNDFLSRLSAGANARPPGHGGELSPQEEDRQLFCVYAGV